MAATIDLEWIRGDSVELQTTATKNGDPIDLTGGKVWMSARRRPNSSTYVFQKDSDGNGIEITNAGLGLSTISILPTDTSILPNENVVLYYDVQVLESDGTVSTTVTGKISISPDVTQEIS